jgi:hypothetical protein
MGAIVKHSRGWTLTGAAAACAALVIGGISGLASGNPDYLGILAGTNPTGYQVSPNAYDISGGPITVTLDQSVTNLTSQTQTVPLSLRVHHILTLNGLDISDGQPGQTGITWTQGLWRNTTQAPVGQTPTISVTVPPMGSPATQLSFSWTFDSCGYFQLDITGHPPAALGSAFVRVLGCNTTFAQRFTPGYWKNHQAATTALLPQSLGGYTVSTFAQATAIFDAMKCSQPANCLAGHLLAAELDVANGSAPCIASTISNANSFLISIGYNGVQTYSLTKAQAGQALGYEATLDNYTNDSTSGTC